MHQLILNGMYVKSSQPPTALTVNGVLTEY